MRQSRARASRRDGLYEIIIDGSRGPVHAISPSGPISLPPPSIHSPYPNQSAQMSLEKLSSNKAFGGELIKYKFKVRAPGHPHGPFVCIHRLRPRIVVVVAPVCCPRRPQRQLQPLHPRQRRQRQGPHPHLPLRPHLHRGQWVSTTNRPSRPSGAGR